MVAVPDASATVAGSRVFTCPGEPMTSTTPIDRTDWDDAVRPADDFYRHVNGRWLAGHPVPPEYGAYGAFHEVNERNQELLHRLLHEAADEPGAAGSVRHKVGDYFMAGTDEEAIAAAGTEPIQRAAGGDRRDRVRRRRPSPRPASSSATGSARSTASASPPTSRMRTPTSSTSGRAGWGSPTATTTSRTTSAPRSCWRPTAATSRPSWATSAARRRSRSRPRTGSSPSSAGSPRRHSPRSSSATRS